MDSNKDGNPVEKDDVQNGSDVNKPVAPLPETSQNLGSGNSEGTLERSNASKDGDNPNQKTLKASPTLISEKIRAVSMTISSHMLTTFKQSSSKSAIKLSQKF